MALFKRQNGASDIPPELQPYYDGTTEKASDKGWLRWLIRGGIAVVVLILLALGGTWIWNTVTGDKDSKPESSSITDNDTNQSDRSGGRTSSTSTTEPATPNTTGPTNSSSQSTSTSPATPNSAASSQTANTSASAPQSAESLASTGPRETVALFVITLITATVLYQYRLRSRTAK